MIRCELRSAMRATSAPFPLKNSIFAESEGYEPADFDRLVEISGESGGAEEIDENMLLEGHA